MELGIFGGTFDPIHNAHLAVAKAARDTFGLDRVLLIPNAIPPHKADNLTAPFEHRLKMVELAIKDEPGLEASDAEAGTGKSYSIHTIEKLVRGFKPEDKPYFIIGADAFAEIQSWFRWRDVIAKVAFVVVARPGHVWEVPADATVYRLDSIHLEVSSSEIRAQLAVCQRPSELPEAVFDYICKHDLYGYGSACTSNTRIALNHNPVSG